MSEAVELAIAEKSPYPEASMFIDAGTPYTEREIADAFDKGLAAVVVSADGSARIIRSQDCSELVDRVQLGD
jgi:hypothetical protein